MDLIFLGCGSSSGAPHPNHLLNPASDCKNCASAHELAPWCNPNYRGNPSLVIRVPGSSGDSVCQIDMAKTFRENGLRWFPRHKIRYVHCVLLSHAHADACFGLDDLRNFQLHAGTKDGIHGQLVPTTIYCDNETRTTIKGQFPWLCRDIKPEQTDSDESGDEKSTETKPAVFRPVANLQWHSFTPLKPFRPTYPTIKMYDDETKELLKDPELVFNRTSSFPVEFIPLPVMHGEDLVSYGYAFDADLTGKEPEWVVYISDVSRILDETFEWLKSLPSISVFVIDSLFLTRDNLTHFSLPATLDVIRKLRPKLSLFTGMHCEFEFYERNEELKKMLETDGLKVIVPCDGLKISLPTRALSHPTLSLPYE